MVGVNSSVSRGLRYIFAILLIAVVGVTSSILYAVELPEEWSGVYPGLTYYNSGAECGTGAVVPWAGRLWVITYSPHKPLGSDDKLYEIDEALDITARAESVGGTPANRMIHRESGQLLIGPYVIDGAGKVRVISPKVMPGRLTGNARHLSDPANKVYYATMEEGFYEVDVRSLKVRQLYRDGNGTSDMASALLPGYHGKGLYSGQGVMVYANNGESGSLARKRPDIASGCLAEWDGTDWTVVRRNQFTEVTGPGGIYGNANPDSDPIWSIGWDHRSLILMMREGGGWRSFRLPKASHCYDGAHGWNTEWPRIRDIGEDDLVMTMHGMLWRFPRGFSMGDTSGIRPRSSYLMVVGDFCRWNGAIVFGCDVSAKSEFLNKRKAKGSIAGPGESQSNLRFVEPSKLDDFGTAIGRGAVWLRDEVKAGERSDTFLFGGFERRGVHLVHDNDGPVEFVFEVDVAGRGEWSKLKDVTVGAGGYEWVEFGAAEKGQWVRLSVDEDCDEVTAYFQYAGKELRGAKAEAIFDGLVGCDGGDASGGLIRARGGKLRTLHFAAVGASGGECEGIGYYEIDADMKLKRVDDPDAHKWLKENVAVPGNVLSEDAASVVFVDDDGRRYRLPKGDESFSEPGPFGAERIDREVCTERDLFNCHGTFYELPAENAGGFSKIRPIATHNRHISDYCSWRGLLVMTGIDDDAKGNRHIIRSDDGKCAVWVGAVDDLWKLGKPAGRGGPWKDTKVAAGEASDPYLMTGYDRKTLIMSHGGDGAVRFKVEVDIDGDGNWVTYRSFELFPGKELKYEFADAFGAYWIRFTASEDTVATAQLVYK